MIAGGGYASSSQTGWNGTGNVDAGTGIVGLQGVDIIEGIVDVIAVNFVGCIGYYAGLLRGIWKEQGVRVHGDVMIRIRFDNSVETGIVGGEGRRRRRKRHGRGEQKRIQVIRSLSVFSRCGRAGIRHDPVDFLHQSLVAGHQVCLHPD